MRYFTALLFYRLRHFETAHMKAILKAVMPYRARVVTITGQMQYFKGLIQDLQTDICKAHEVVARLWLNTSSGDDWLQSIAAARSSNRTLPVATREQIAGSLLLSVKDIGSLWTSVSSIVNPKHWDEEAWNDSGSEDYIFQFMEETTYILIAKMATCLQFGVRAQRTTGVTARLRMLTAITNVDYPDCWPELPTDGLALPDSPEGWKGYPDFYPSCTDNDQFATLFGRFEEIGISLFSKLTNRPIPNSGIDENKTRTHSPPEQDASESNAPVTSVVGAPSAKGPDTDIETVDLTADACTSSQQKSNDVENVADTSITEDLPAPAEEDAATPRPKELLETDRDVPETSFHQGEYLVHQDGNQFSLEGYDDDDEPAQSSWMHTGDEMEKHDDDALEYIARLAQTDHEDDYKVIQEWLDYNNPDMSFLTARAFELARLGGLGLARYVLDDLQSDAAMYARMSEHFAEKRIGRLAEAAELAETLKDLPEKLANLESEAASYRSDSGMASNYQQNITQTRRIMARVQAQVQGARTSVPMVIPGRSGRVTMGPPAIPGRLTSFQSPVASGRQTSAPPGRQTSLPPGRQIQGSTPRRRSAPEFDESDWAA
jgi:hypothetical protein